jgi:hypothetical protein
MAQPVSPRQPASAPISITSSAMIVSARIGKCGEEREVGDDVQPGRHDTEGAGPARAPQNSGARCAEQHRQDQMRPSPDGEVERVGVPRRPDEHLVAEDRGDAHHDAARRNQQHQDGGEQGEGRGRLRSRPGAARLGVVGATRRGVRAHRLPPFL